MVGQTLAVCPIHVTPDPQTASKKAAQYPFENLLVQVGFKKL